jgi:hypothetical protein
MVRRLVVMIVLVLSVPALAQPYDPTDVASSSEPPPTTMKSRSRSDRQSEWVALGLSIGSLWVGTGAFLLMAEGFDGRNEALYLTGAIGANATILIAPSVGHWYAGRAITPGLVVRSAGFAAAGLMAWQHPHCTTGTCVPEWFAIYGIVGAIVTGMLLDLATLPSAVRRANARTERLHLAPLLTRESSGLALGGRF